MRYRSPEVEEFEERLRRRATAIQAAQLSLNQRVREFVDAHGRNGSKSGRPDYAGWVTLDRIEVLRVALDELDRVSAPPPVQGPSPEEAR